MLSREKARAVAQLLALSFCLPAEMLNDNNTHKPEPSYEGFAIRWDVGLLQCVQK